MVGSRVRDLRVVEIGTNEVYDVYDIIMDSSGRDYFLVYNDKLRKENKGFRYIDVVCCMPVGGSVGLTE